MSQSRKLTMLSFVALALGVGLVSGVLWCLHPDSHSTALALAPEDYPHPDAARTGAVRSAAPLFANPQDVPQSACSSEEKAAAKAPGAAASGELTPVVYIPMVVRPFRNYVQNPGFEGITCDPDSEPGWCDGNWTHETHYGDDIPSIFTPQGWVTWWHIGDDYWQPEAMVLPNKPPYTGDFPRIRSGNYAVMLFTFYRRHDAGYYQVVKGLEPGKSVQFSAYAHSFSCYEGTPPGPSCGDLSNVTFQIGIEPNCLADPFAPSIVWTDPISSPDYYSLIGPVTAEVGDTGSVCVYLRSKTKFGYKYQDAFWDDTKLIALP